MTDKQLTELIGIIEAALLGEDTNSAFAPIDALYKLQDEIERLREVERKALEQSEYIQKHGLTEWEMALKNAEVERLRAALTDIVKYGVVAGRLSGDGLAMWYKAKAALDAAGECHDLT